MDEQMRDVKLSLDEIKECMDSLGDHGTTGDFEPECPGCTAYAKLSAALSQPAAQEIDELKTICAETYQVVGSLASDLGIFGSCLQLGKVLDNLSQQKRVHNDVLPWPSFEAQGDSSHPAGGECGGVRA